MLRKGGFARAGFPTRGFGRGGRNVRAQNPDFNEIWMFLLDSGSLFGSSSVHLARFLTEIRFWTSVEVNCFRFGCQTVARQPVSY